MSNAARKTRKALNNAHRSLGVPAEQLRYQHQDKGEATPVPLRGISSRAKLKRMAALIEVGRGEALTDYMAKLGQGDNAPTGTPIEYLTAAPTPPRATPIELDPKPFLCGKSRFGTRARAEVSKAAADGATPRFAPREDYSQAISDYVTN